jgi:GDP/UDP-N,N'-diacetylbacillosamine 2-epimerase (hydrolysing)
MMKIGLLTSSRADYGVYLPLIAELKNDAFFELEIIAFGTHMSKFHGYTLNEIRKDETLNVHEISSLVASDEPQGIATSYALTVQKFADFWATNTFDLVLCLGDRFEMSAAVQAGIPFRARFAHIHGGETTLGAIDNIYRHQITLASVLHFTSAELHTEKVKTLTGSDKNIHTVGALSLDELSVYKPIDKKIFYDRFGLSDDFALVTFHPETVNADENIRYAGEMKKALVEISRSIQIVVTMPNADTLGTAYRKRLEHLKAAHPDRVILIENFGKENYFSAMHYAKVMVGNTSSGIVEAASFRKYVVNVGERQKGRLQSTNIFEAQFTSEDIIAQTIKAINAGEFTGENIFFRQGAAKKIIKSIKSYENV